MPGVGGKCVSEVRHNGRVTHVAIIGGGPGGYEAALVAARLGADVTLVERDGPGGSTVLTDCVPSKTLIATSDLLTEVESAAELGVDVPTDARADVAVANDRVLALAKAQSDDIGRRLESSGVEVLAGTATLDPSGGIVATTADGERRIETQGVLVATGAHPRVVDTAQPDGERILTWEQLYGLRELPEHMIVVGSGVTGAEFASAYNGLGSPVTLVSSRDRVLPGEDEDAATLIEDVFTRRGMTVLDRSRMASVERRDDGVRVTLTDGREVDGSHCLLALGSVPNTDDLGLKEAGVELDDAGFVKVDRVSRTSVSGVYAAGDCTGVLMLASVAAQQGRIAMSHLLGDAVHPLDLKKVSSNIFTSPEIATVGLSQVQLRGGRDAVRGRDAAAGRQPAGQDAGHPRRVRQALLESGHRDRHRRCGRQPAGQRAHPRRVVERLLVPDGRPCGRRVHHLSVVVGVGGRGGATPASSGLTSQRVITRL